MSRSIVIIDDDRSLLDGMKYAIPWSEFHVEWAGEAIDGREGMEVIHECSLEEDINNLLVTLDRIGN